VLTANPNPSNNGAQVTFTATVSPVGSPPASVTGTVNFIDTSNANAVICSAVALVSGVATCQTSSLTASTHNVRADYSGDGNFDPLNSNVVAQVVNTCSSNPVVTSTADSGANTLRDALLNICTSPNNNVTFNLGAGPHTITPLSTLVIAKDVTITNTIGAGNGPLTIDANGGAFRVFRVDGPVTTAGLSNFTIKGANTTANSGGGLFVQSGTVTLTGMLFTGNTVINGSGGGVGVATGATVNIRNSTVSGNTATNGGGLYNGGGTFNLLNVTVTNNNANGNVGTGACPTAGSVNGAGGAIDNASNTTNIRNSILAGNTACDSGFLNVSGTVTDQGNNLLSGNPGLALLADNGGATMTHALLGNSPALDAGDNASATAAGLTTDQRGTGFPRIADSADADTTATVDIGAYEAHPTVEDISDKSTAEDTPLSFGFNIGDGTGALITSVTASSSNTALVPNDVAHLSVTGSGSTRTLNITPAADANTPANGTATITVTVTATNGQTAQDTFVLTVTEVNDAPTAGADVVSDILEDSGVYSIPIATLLSNDSKGPANESGQTLSLTAVGSPTGGTVVINGANVEFTPTANFNGAAGFSYTVSDNGTTNGVADPKTGIGSVSFNITAVNDAPSFTKGADQTVNEDAGAQTVNNWATNISAGAANESGQLLTFNVTNNTNSGLFSSQPAVSATGTLTYTPAANTFGSSTITLTLSDNGGTANGGQDTSGSQSFTITVNGAPDTPSVGSPTTLEDTQTGAISVTKNVNDGAEVTYFKVTGITNGKLYFNDGTTEITNNTFVLFSAVGAGLKFTPTANLNSPGSSFGFSVQASTSNSDAGLGGGVATSTITVTAVNDVPSFTKGPDPVVLPNPGAQTVNNWATNISAGPADESGQLLNFIVTNDNNALFSAQPAVSASGTLTYTPAVGQAGLATVSVSLHDNGGTANGGVDTSAVQMFTITVSCGQNDLVTNTNDNGVGSLRYAISSACVGDTITFDPALTSGGPATIALTSAELVINRNLTIVGPGANLLTVQRSTAGGTPNFRVFNITATGSVNISGLTIRNGVSNANGGGIYNAATDSLTITSCAVLDNTASGSNGGGVLSLGSLTIGNSTFANNYAQGGQGGGIDSEGGTLTLFNATISGNRADTDGGGLLSGGSSLTALTNVTITNNRADADGNATGAGGGIGQTSSNPITLKNTIVAANTTNVGLSTSDDDLNNQIVPASPIDAASANNLIGVNTGFTGIDNFSNGNQVGTVDAPLNPGLFPLANYGGPTQTHLLHPDSVAVGGGNNTFVTNPPFAGPPFTDQRGGGFARVVNTTVDIGAVEVSYAITQTAGSGQSATINSSFATPLQATVRESGTPLSGVFVTFLAPAGGASGIFSGSADTIESVLTDGSGIATASVFTANGSAGGPYNVVASLAGGSPSVNFSLTNLKGNQSITVNTHAPAIATYNSSFTVAAVASSGLPVNYISAGACTNVGPIYTITSGTGTCTVTYDQSGNSDYNPAAPLTESVIAHQASQTITVNTHAPASAIYNTSFTVAATSNSGLAVVYSSSGVCTNAGPVFTMTGGTGTCTVNYNQSGDGNYSSAPQVTESVIAHQGVQTITVNTHAPASATNNGSFTVAATASSGLAVVYSSSGVCTNAGPIFTMTGSTGTCTVKYNQSGDANYGPAAQVTESVTAQQAATATAVSSSVNPSEFGQSVTFTATVTSGAGTPTGTVQFKDGGVNIGAAQTLNGGGVAQLTTSSLTAGTHTITAVYSGDVNFLTSTGTLSGGQVVKSQPSLSINDVSFAEGNSGTTNMIFTVTLSAASSLTVNVNYATANGTATLADNDYQAASCTLTFNPGELTKTITVLVNGDQKFEPDETVLMNLTSPVNATISDNQGTGTILNDDTLQLILDESGPDANQATALDSLLFLRDPFHVQSIVDWIDIGPDRNTRVLIFAANLQLNQGETASAVVVNLVDANNQSFDVPAEDVRAVPGFAFTQVKFRLPNNLAAGVCMVTIKAHGQVSNTGTMRIVLP
jgi:hypothetical protein